MGTKFWWTLVATFAGVTAWVVSLHFWRITRKRAPPGSIGWPLLGETLLFLKPHPSTSTGPFLHQRVQRFGRVFKSHLFGEPAIVSCDPDLNAYVLQNEDRLFQCSYPTAIHGILGEMSMLVVVGDAHKRLRTLALSLVNAAKNNPNFLSDIETNALLITGKWKQKQTVVFCEEARKFTFTVIVKQILSLKPDSPETSTILKDFLTFMKGLASLPLYIPGTPYAKAVKSKSEILSTLKKLVDRRRNEGIQRGDFLDMLLTSTSLADDEILSLVLDLLLGGYETTAVLIAMVVKFLTDCPSALQQLKSEHEKIRRGKQKGESGLNWDDYKQMSFTQNVINEALRCGNVVKFVHRKVLKDVKFKGYDIPAGWKILPMFSAVHLDSSSFKDPQEFNPWRWQTAIAGKQFTPFGGGPRLCPGSELAKVETAFFIHHLVLNFRWRAAEVDHSVAYPYVEFEKGLPIHVERLSMAD